MSSREAPPYIAVWDSRKPPGGPGASCTELQRINFASKTAARVLSLGFSADGQRLAAVTADQEHTVWVYDWRSGQQLFDAHGGKAKVACCLNA